MDELIRQHPHADMVLAECDLGGEHWIPEGAMYDGKGEVAGREALVPDIISRASAELWVRDSEELERAGAMWNPHNRRIGQTIVALYAKIDALSPNLTATPKQGDIVPIGHWRHCRKHPHSLNEWDDHCGPICEQCASDAGAEELKAKLREIEAFMAGSEERYKALLDAKEHWRERAEAAERADIRALTAQIGQWHRSIFGEYDPADHVSAIGQKAEEEASELRNADTPAQMRLEVADLLICALAAADRLGVCPMNAAREKLDILIQRGKTQLQRDRERGIVQAADRAALAGEGGFQ